MTLIFDTETTGLVKKWDDSNHSSNPHLVQLGFTVCTDEGRSIFTFAAILLPYYEQDIEVGAYNKHGISKEFASKVGLAKMLVKEKFVFWLERCDTIVAHNLKFDKLIVEKAFEISLDDKKSFCTMLESTQFCKLEGSYGHKWPKLNEAYQYFFNAELIGAHDALTDVMACKRIYFEGLNEGKSLKHVVD